MPADPAVAAALREAEDALLLHLWVHEAGHDPLHLTPQRIAAIRSYGEDSSWNIKTRGAAASIAAFLHYLGASGVLWANEMAAAVTRAAEDDR